MFNLIVSQARSAIARVLNVCETDPAVLTILNEAESRLLNRSDKPVGSLVRVKFCLNRQSCFSWPRQIQTVEAYAVCNQPGIIRGPAFEFIGYPNGIGPQHGGGGWCGANMLLDRGTAVSFEDVNATSEAKKIELLATNAADVGKTVILKYYDSNGNKVYTSIDGVVQEGEELTLVAPPASVLTSRDVLTDGLYQVIKEVTDYPIIMYEVNSADTTDRTKMLSYYEPSETTPIYRRSFVPGVGGCCADDDDDEEEDCDEVRHITALVKLQHVPLVNNNDTLVIGNLPALKLMVMGILREEQNRFDESQYFKAEAARELDGELASYTGDGQVQAVRVQEPAIFGAGGHSVSGGFGGWNW